MSISFLVNLVPLTLMTAQLSSVSASDFAEDFARCVEDSNSLNPCLHQVAFWLRQELKESQSAFVRS